MSAPTAQPRSAEEQSFLEDAQKKKIRVLAIHTPRWMGVSASTRMLFEHTFALPAEKARLPQQVPAAEMERKAQLLAESGIAHFVCSGGDEIHFNLVRRIKALRPEARIDFLWHGNFMQMGDPETRRLMKLWIDGAKAGIVTTLGTVKKGMDELFASYGVRSRFVMNFVSEIPQSPSTPDAGGLHLGLWLSGPKLSYAMLSAARLIAGSVVHGSNIDAQTRGAMEFLGLATQHIRSSLLSRDALFAAIRRTHLSLYVTAAECAPMLPLESLSLGVPCLLGPSSHYFEDAPELHARLVVPYPDRADVIAKMARQAIDRRSELIRDYIAYAPDYIERAKASVAAFLGSD